jgi:hypothetical protein
MSIIYSHDHRSFHITHFTLQSPQEIKQVVAEVKAQSQVVDNARRTLREAENAMFLADQKLSKFVCEVEDATVALKVQGGLDKNRCARVDSVLMALCQC